MLDEGTQFRGTTRDAVTILLYLQNKYQDECVLLSHVEAALKQNKQAEQEIDAPLSWYDVGAVWVHGKLWLPDEFYSRTRKCPHRFLLVPLTLVSRDLKGFHANFIIVDTHKRVLERFEPYGQTPRAFLGGATVQVLCDALLEVALKALGDTASVINPLHVAKWQLQLQQETEKLMDPTKGDPLGYCLAWSALYVDTRLACPLLRAEHVPAHLIRLMEAYPQRMTLYIQKYSAQLRALDAKARREHKVLDAAQIKRLLKLDGTGGTVV